MKHKSQAINPMEDLGPILAESIEVDKHEEILFPTLKALNNGSSKKVRAREVKRYFKKLTGQIKKAGTKSKLKGHGNSPVHIAKFLAQPMPENKWLVKSLIPDGCVTVISGEPKNFKTWIILHLAKQIAEGELVFNEFATVKHKVLVIEEDDKPRTIRDRALILGCHKELEIHVWVNSGFKVEEDIEQLIAYVKKNKIGVVILDCLVRIYNGDENSSRDVARLFEQIQRLTNLGVTVVITHHHRKSQMGYTDRTPMRGSSDILAAVDCHLVVERRGKLRIRVTQPKVRTDMEVAPFGVEIETDKEKYFRFVFTDYETQEDEEKYSKTELAEQHISTLLSEHDTMDRQEMILELKQHDIGQNVADIAIKNLASKNLIAIETGAKGKKTLRSIG